MRRPLSRRTLVVIALVLAGAVATIAGADDAPRLLSVLPERSRDMIACRIRTAGLPAAPSLESMQGGLPAAVDFVVELVDDRDQLVQRREFAFRLAFDLWEEVFRVDGPGIERRVGGVDSLRAALKQLGPFPIVPLERLGAGQRYRMRVEMLEHAVAPSQKARIGRMLASGGAREDREHEVSFGFGRLIEFFYGRAPDGAPPRTVGISGWFTPEEVGHGSP